MGKSDEEQALSNLPSSSQELRNNAVNVGCRQCCWIRSVLRLRCVVAVVLGIAVVLSAVFWISPLMRGRKGGGETDLGSGFGADIIASFKLQRSVSELNESISELQYDIFGEIGVPNSLVVIISLSPLGRSNWTDVVFGVLPYPTNSAISSAGLSIIRSYFESFVIEQSTLHLTPSLFGNSSFFQVLKFPEGITIIPPQSAFLLQKVQILFNFTLNFSIYQVQDKIDELKDQMRTGLHLSSGENLYVSLTNMLGSTISPPTIVQTSILAAVGPPSKSRLKELAKTIECSPARNLGLNHSVFGRVKQVRLSSFLQHSLGGSTSGSASPTPQPHPTQSDHYHHHHHHHHHHDDDDHHNNHDDDKEDHHRHYHHQHHHHKKQDSRTPLTPPPIPQHSYQDLPPSHFPLGSSRKSKNRSHIVPTAAPVSPSSHSSASTSTGDADYSPLPAVSFANVQPPGKNITAGESPNNPLPSSCCHPDLQPVLWVLAPLLYFLVQL